MEAGRLALCVPIGPCVSSLDAWIHGERPGETWFAVCHGKVCEVWRFGKHREGDAHALGPEIVHRLSEKDAKTLSVCRFSPCGQMLAAGGGDRVVRLWCMKRGELLFELRGHGDHILDCAFLSTRLLFSCSADGKVLVWDTQSGECVAVLNHSSTVRSIACYPCKSYSGARLLCGQSDGSISVWDIESADSYIATLEELEQDVAEEQGAAIIREPSRTAVDGPVEDDDNKSVELGRERHLYRACLIGCTNAYTCGITRVSASSNGCKLATGGLNGVIRTWNILGLQNDLESHYNLQLNHAIERKMCDEYIELDESALVVADGGAGAHEDCLEEFYATLNENQGRGTLGGGNSQLVRQQDQYDKNRLKQLRKRATLEIEKETSMNHHAAVEETVMRCETCFQQEGACTDVSFSRPGSSSLTIEQDGLAFSASEDCMLRIWSCVTGYLLFQIKTPEPCKSVQAFSFDQGADELSKHQVICASGGKVLVFTLIGLVELQILLEYAVSAHNTTCEAFWAHSERPKALARALRISGYGDTPAERKKLSQLFHEKGKGILARTQGRQVLHGANAEVFLQTFVGRREEAARNSFGSRLFANMEKFKTGAQQICRALVTSPFSTRDILHIMAMSESSFLEKTKAVELKDLFSTIQAGESISGIMHAAQYSTLKPTERNRWGGDQTLGMFSTKDENGNQKYFFYAYESASDRAKTSGFAPSITSLAKPLYEQRAKDIQASKVTAKGKGVLTKRALKDFVLPGDSAGISQGTKQVSAQGVSQTASVQEKVQEKETEKQHKVPCPRPVPTGKSTEAEKDGFVIDAFANGLSAQVALQKNNPDLRDWPLLSKRGTLRSNPNALGLALGRQKSLHAVNEVSQLSVGSATGRTAVEPSKMGHMSAAKPKVGECKSPRIQRVIKVPEENELDRLLSVGMISSPTKQSATKQEPKIPTAPGKLGKPRFPQPHRRRVTTDEVQRVNKKD